VDQAVLRRRVYGFGPLGVPGTHDSTQPSRGNDTISWLKEQGILHSQTPGSACSKVMLRASGRLVLAFLSQRGRQCGFGSILHAASRMRICDALTPSACRVYSGVERVRGGCPLSGGNRTGGRPELGLGWDCCCFCLLEHPVPCLVQHQGARAECCAD
jgi:hypothetical protein